MHVRGTESLIRISKRIRAICHPVCFLLGLCTILLSCTQTVPEFKDLNSISNLAPSLNDKVLNIFSDQTPLVLMGTCDARTVDLQISVKGKSDFLDPKDHSTSSPKINCAQGTFKLYLNPMAAWGYWDTSAPQEFTIQVRALTMFGTTDSKSILVKYFPTSTQGPTDRFISSGGGTANSTSYVVISNTLSVQQSISTSTSYRLKLGERNND